MTGPALAHIRDTADELASSVANAGQGSTAVWQLAGRVTAGKSSCLAEAAELISERAPEAIPVLLTPPPRQLDTGPAILVDFGVGLSARVQLNGGLQRWAETRKTWRDRLADTRAWLEEHQDRVVLLCDDPTHWGDVASEETAFFTGRAVDASRLFLEQARCRRIVAGHLPDSLKADELIGLEPPPPDRAWLLDADAWGPLADAAQALANADADLETLSPLELRLLVGLSALQGAPIATRGIEGRGRSELAARFWDAVAEDQSLTRLKRAWLRLSFVRRAFSSDLLDELGLNELSRRDAALVRHTLVFGDEQRLRLHEVLRSQARSWHREQATQSRQQTEKHAGRILAHYYIGRFEAAAARDAGSAVADSMEAFHFVSFAGDAELLTRVTPYFTEQLDALGWRLSYVYRRFEDAAEVFGQAIEWDDEDDYAHHYLAFNLDRSGQAPRKVEEHYLRAIDLSPGNSWWHARFIAFLAHRGRTGDARRQWEEAQVVLSVSERTSDRFLFETLHLWVADALLDRAELAFAREVLDDVPEWARRGEILPAYPRLRRRLVALQQAAEGGALVPAHRLVARWWENGPELLQDRVGEDNDRRLVRWLAARVERLDEEGVHLRAAQVELGTDSPPPTGEMVIDAETFARLCRDTERAKRMAPGWHTEIGIYASRSRPDTGTTTVIRVHEPRPADWADESPFDSGRYIRRSLQRR